MKMVLILGLIAAVLTISAEAVFGLAQTKVYKSGPITPIGNASDTASRELTELFNLAGPVYGKHSFFSELGDWERLYFKGGPKTFGKFLEMYSKLKYKPLTLTVHYGPPPPIKGAFGSNVDKQTNYNWRLKRYMPGTKPSGEQRVELDVWLDRDVTPDRLQVPSNIVVKAGEKGNGKPDSTVIKQNQSFAIYLLEEASITAVDLEQETPTPHWSLKDLPLQAEPLLTADDLTAYRWRDHTMLLKPGVAQRVTKALGKVLTRPLVVVANGNRVYHGSFVSPLSSYLPSAPVIFVDEPLKPENEFMLRMLIRGSTDPRGDQQIKKALEKAGKLPVENDGADSGGRR